MGTAVSFEGVNVTLNPPPGRDDVVALQAFQNGECVVTAWVFTPEELDDIGRTGRIFVSQHSGKTIYPMFVGSSRSVQELVSRYGATIPNQKDAT